MAYQQLFSYDDLSKMNLASPRPLGTLAGRSIKINNMSNRGMTVQMQGITLDYIQPYGYLIMQNQGELSLLPDSAVSLNYLHPNANVSVVTVDDMLPYQTGQLLSLTSPAPNSTQTVLSLQLKQDPSSGFVPAGSGFKTFQHTISYFQFWNMDKSGRIVYLNFNKATTNGSDNTDYQLLPDPNKLGDGAYYSVSAAYNGIYYSGGDWQVMAWYNPASQ